MNSFRPAVARPAAHVLESPGSGPVQVTQSVFRQGAWNWYGGVCVVEHWARKNSASSPVTPL